MNIKNELKSNQILLLLMSSSAYNSTAIKVFKQLDGKICYITFNKTYQALKDIFLKNKISTEKIIFIDCITKSMYNIPVEVKDCYFIESPVALNEISIWITEVLNKNIDYIIFDSLTNFFIYENSNNVLKFVFNITNKIKNTKTKALFYAPYIKGYENLIKKSEMFADSVIYLGVEKK